MCDGGLQLLPYPEGHSKLVASLRRVIAPGGVVAIRMFVLPEEQESPGAVLRDLWAGRIANLNLLKIRLGMALARGAGHCVSLRAVWDAVHRAAPDLPALAAAVGWPLEHLQVIQTYRDRHTRYWFVGLEEARRLFCESPGGFALEQVNVPTYELGERCPTAIFRREA